MRSEVSFDKFGDEVASGTKGSIRPDIIIERMGPNGPEVVDVMDLKTGKAGIGTTWATHVKGWLDPLGAPQELRPVKVPPPTPVAGR